MKKSISNFINQVFPLPNNSEAQKAQSQWLWRNRWFGQDTYMTIKALIAIEKIKEIDKLDNNSPGFWYAVDFHIIALKERDFEIHHTLH